MPEVLPELVIYALLFFAVAFAFAARKLTQALFGPLIAALQAIPLIGSKLAEPFHAIEQAVTGACYSIENGADKAMGAIWHRTVELLNWTWREVKRHALVGVETALYIPLLISAYHHLRNLVHAITHANDGSNARIKRLEKEYRGIEAQIKRIDHILAKLNFKGIDAELRTLSKEIAHVDNVEIPAIRSRVGTLDGAIGTVEGYLDLPTDLTRPAWLAGIVATALGALGLGGLSCSNFKGLLNKYACGLGKMLDDLLGIVIAGLVLESVCQFLGLLEDAFGAVVGPLTSLLNDVPLGACEQPPNDWAVLSVVAGPRPDAQTLGQLPPP